jgi:hypothetical protein
MYPELWRHNDGHFSWNPLRMLGGNDIDNWKVVLYTTQLACALIMIRCVFRCVKRPPFFRTGRPALTDVSLSLQRHRILLRLRWQDRHDRSVPFLSRASVLASLPS